MVSRQRRVTLRWKVAKRDKFHCFWCQSYMDFDDGTLDHIVPRSKGGGNGVGNLVWACHPCNNERGDMPAEHYVEIKLRKLSRI